MRDENADPPSVPGEPRAEGVSAVPAEELTLLSLANTILRQRRLVVLASIVAVGLALLLYFTRDPAYRADSVFMPQTSSTGASRMAGLAAQLGVDVAGSVDGEPLPFFAGVLQSRELMRSTALTEYRFARNQPPFDTIAGTLVEIFEVEGETEEERIRRAVGRLADLITTSSDTRTGLVHLTTTAPWPDLATQINRRMLDLLNEFNLERRQSQAGAERLFVENRLAAVRDDVRGAEAQLEAFLERTRRLGTSPQLTLERTRLQRAVEFQQQLYLALAQSYEQARIDEVRNTPVITVIDPPEGSSRSIRMGLIPMVVIAIVLGGFVGVVLAFVREFMQRQQQLDGSAYREFRTLSRDAMGDLVLRGLWSRKRSRGTPRSAPSPAPPRSDGSAVR